MRPRVFITQPIAESALRRLEARADVACNRDPLHIVGKAELIAALRDTDYLYCMLHDTVDADVIGANPALKVVASTTITPANIDVAAATARKIPVTVIPPMVTEATADLTLALLLAVARRVAEADRLMRQGVFPGAQSRYLEGRGVSGRTLGLVGAGQVGQAVARRARGFGMRIVYHDPRRLDDRREAELGMTWMELGRVLAEADFVSLHPALTPATRHLIGAAELARMKPSAYLINTSRGPVVDEKALVLALQSRRLAGAGLDVYEREPHPAPELLTLPNVVMTPHVGSAVGELREAMAHVAVDNIVAVMDDRRPPNCVNPEIYG
jgi:glyoxylate reductase